MSNRGSGGGSDSGVNSRDRYYAEPQDMLVDFVFDSKVASVFPDMIRRSVPGYETIISQLSVFARQFATNGSRIYDLGCSTGASSLALARGLSHLDHYELVAIDNSIAMLENAKHNLRGRVSASLRLICADVCDIAIVDASVACLNFTLQFIQPAQRSHLLRKIYQGLRPGAVLILSEKLCFDVIPQQRFMESMHLAFKRENAYSELEIAQKRSALEKVLLPESLATHLTRLRECGFEQSYPWFQDFNFVSIAAIKSA